MSIRRYITSDVIQSLVSANLNWTAPDGPPAEIIQELFWAVIDGELSTGKLWIALDAHGLLSEDTRNFLFAHAVAHIDKQVTDLQRKQLVELVKWLIESGLLSIDMIWEHCGWNLVEMINSAKLDSSFLMLQLLKKLCVPHGYLRGCYQNLLEEFENRKVLPQMLGKLSDEEFEMKFSARFNHVITSNRGQRTSQFWEHLHSTSRFCTDFEEIRILGRGSFGVVKLVRSNFDKQFYAVKMIPIKKDVNKAAVETVWQEVQLLSSLVNVPQVTSYHSAWVEYVDDYVTPDPSPEKSLQGKEEKEYTSSQLDFNFDTPDYKEVPSALSVESSISLQSQGTATPSESFNLQSNYLMSDEESLLTERLDNDSEGFYDDERNRATYEKHSQDKGVIAGKDVVKVILIQMELCATQKLSDCFVDKCLYDKINPKEVFLDITTALMAVHEQNIVHGDVAAQNVFFRRNSWRAVLGDFGLALKINGQDVLTKGTVEYQPPEGIASQAGDVYALGVLSIRLFKFEADPVKRHNVKGAFPRSTGYDAGVKTCIQRLLVHDPVQRPSAHQILSDPEFEPLRGIDPETSVKRDLLNEIQVLKSQLTRERIFRANGMDLYNQYPYNQLGMGFLNY